MTNKGRYRRKKYVISATLYDDERGDGAPFWFLTLGCNGLIAGFNDPKTMQNASHRTGSG